LARPLGFFGVFYLPYLLTNLIKKVMLQRCGQKHQTPFAKAFKDCGIGCCGRKKIVLFVVLWKGNTFLNS